MRRKREDWQKLVDELRRSGQSQQEFAEAREIKPGTLSWWSWRLGAKTGKAAPARKRQGAAVQFIPVNLPSTAPAASIEIAVADFNVRFPANASAEYIGAVMLELEALC